MSTTTNRNNSKTKHHNNRREFLKSGATAAGLGFLDFGLKPQSLLSPGMSVATLPPQDEPGTHNMLVLGERMVYLSHLPMFDELNDTKTEFTSQHRYQVILDVAFTSGNRDLTPVYTADRQNHPLYKIYTLNPARFVLPDLDPAGSTPLRKFRGNAVFRGHLEKQGIRIMGGFNPGDDGFFDVNVKNVVHFHKFDPQALKPSFLEYLLFGKGSELFLAHFITRPNEFDQIVGINLQGHPFTDTQLSKGIHVVFFDRANTARERMREGQKALGGFQFPGEVPRTLPVEVIRDYYFEEGELSVPPTLEDTPLEKFDDFSPAEQKSFLSEKGPLLPGNFNMNDVPMRAFIKGDWPLLVAYSLREGTATLNIAVEGVHPFSQVLTAGVKKQVINMIPKRFGDQPQVANISIKTLDFLDPNSFTLHAIGIVPETKNGGPSRNNHHADYQARFPVELPIDNITIRPNEIRPGRGESLIYKFFSRRHYNSGDAEFFRFTLTPEGVVPVRVFSNSYRDIGANEETQARHWDGKNWKGDLSFGLHRLEIRTWRGQHSGGDWFGPYYGPEVQVLK